MYMLLILFIKVNLFIFCVLESFCLFLKGRGNWFSFFLLMYLDKGFFLFN